MARLVFTEKDHNAYDPKKYKVTTAELPLSIKWALISNFYVHPKVVHKNHWRQVSLLLQPSNKKWWEDPDVIVAWVENIEGRTTSQVGGGEVWVVGTRVSEFIAVKCFSCCLWLHWEKYLVIVGKSKKDFASSE